MRDSVRLISNISVNNDKNREPKVIALINTPGGILCRFSMTTFDNVCGMRVLIIIRLL